MKEFIKNSNGCLVPTDQAKVKVFDSIQAAQTALDNGELSENEVFATRFTDNGEDMALEINAMADDIATLQSYVPSGTDGGTNQLVNQCQLSCAMGDAKVDVYCESTCVCTVSAAAPLNLAANAFNENAQIDLTTYPGACCKGKVTAVCQGTDCYLPDNSGVITIPVGTDPSAVGAIVDTCLAQHSGIDCTGTVVASDLASFIDATCAGTIANACIATHDGVDCIGNVCKSNFTLSGTKLTITL